MRIPPRVRVLALLSAACLVGWVTVSWGLLASENLVRFYRGGGPRCTGTWRDFGNEACGSGSYDVVVSWIEVLACIAILLGAGCMLTLWALRPLRAMLDTVARLGPTSLGLRLRADGPRDEVRRLSDAIDAMLDRVSEGYESQRRFAANASHELRTPLATQRALIEVSLSESLTPEQLRLLSRQLLATNERNENLIEGLLALAETERGLMVDAPLRLDVVASDVVALLGPMAHQAAVTVDVTTAEASTAGEHALVNRLVSNLVQNAIKYNDPGGWVRVHVDAAATLIVANSGPVVAAETVPSLFEPFRRLSGERLEHGGGIGLGLTIVRSIAAAHHAALQAQPNPDGGLTVTVWFRASGG